MRKRKKITLESLHEQITKGFASVEKRMESGFAATAEDITDIKQNMATKDQIISLHTQVNSIEKEHLGIKYARLENRVDKLDEKVFGKIQA